MNIIAALLCIILFALTAPFTKIATLETTAEAAILLRIMGGGFMCLIIVLLDKWRPPKKIWFKLIQVSLGSVIGFASFMSFAMKEVPSSHAAVGLAALPIATAAYSSLRDKINPGIKFWFFAISGTLISFSFFFLSNVNILASGDIYLILAVLSAAFGYVEGGRLSRVHSGTRVMSWAIVITLPITILLSLYYFNHFPSAINHLSLKAWTSLAYLALISQAGGMFLWLKVLARGPMEKIALVQLLQPFFTLLASIVLVHEAVLYSTWVIAALVAACILGANHEKQNIRQMAHSND